MKKKKKKIAFIINPKSGIGNKRQLPRIIEETIDHLLFKPIIKFTRYRGHATSICIKLMEKGVRKFVAVGGDGTVNEIAKVIIETNCSLGIIPTGSGNGLARHLKIPMKIGRAIDLLNNSKTVEVDYGMINDCPFFCTCGVGFDARIGNLFAESHKRGFYTYAKTSLTEFFKYSPEKYTLLTEKGKIKNRAFLITFANASQYGNNAFIAPRANIQDGLADICIVKPFPRIKIFELGIRLFRKSIDKSRYTETFRAREISIKRKKPGEVHYDGEPLMLDKEFSLRIVKSGLKVLVSKTSQLS